MKNLIFLLLTALVLTSCSNESSSDSNDFFNLNDGNLWVYKRYTSSNNATPVFSGLIDSVRVEGDTLINGITYKKLRHESHNSGGFSTTTKECLRVDSNGHLVNQNEYVLHSGTDVEYQHVRPVIVGGTTNVGSVTEQLQDPLTTTIEGTNYFVYPYYGTFVSTEATIPNNYIFYQYKEGLGMVCQHCSAVAGSSYYQDRLVYYELN